MNYWYLQGASLVVQRVKSLCACNAGDPGSIPGSGRSPGERNGYPLQYSCLENSMDRGAWQATVHGVTRVGHNWVTKPPLYRWVERSSYTCFLLMHSVWFTISPTTRAQFLTRSKYSYWVSENLSEQNLMGTILSNNSYWYADQSIRDFMQRGCLHEV